MEVAGALYALAAFVSVAGATDGTVHARRGDTTWVTDDLGRTLVFARPPDRIVSLIPAVTEVLFAIGAGESVAGRSRWDDYPPEVLNLPNLGDAVRPSTELVLAHRPDVVILFAGSDNEPAVREFERLGIPSLAVALNTLPDFERTVGRLGLLTGRTEAAEALLTGVRRELRRVKELTRHLPPRSVYYDIWYPPAITIGAGSYLDSLIAIAGGRNIFSDLASPSPQVSLEAIAERDPEVILYPLTAEPAGRQTPPTKRPGWNAVRAVREGSVRTVDADIVHRLGPRIGQAAAILAVAIHPEVGVVGPPDGAPPARGGGRGSAGRPLEGPMAVRSDAP